MSVRTRFAPSPTGVLHIGSVRTALFCWLYARHHGGQFILRVEDTDPERSTLEYEEAILDGLRWLGLDWDEGIGSVGGPHGTYRQSDRLERYQEVAEQLVADGKAYESWVTQEELDEFHRQARGMGISPAYDGGAEPDDFGAAARRTSGAAPTIRFRVPRPGVTEFDDIVRGEVGFEHDHVDDFVILRHGRRPRLVIKRPQIVFLNVGGQ